MPNISIRLDRVDGQDALKQVEHAMNQVGFADELTIIMESVNARHSDEISDLLAKNHFDFQPVGSHDGNEYILKARRTAKRV
ncbi:hypothetical protein [Desulforamulus putei]|uniref:Uncharacterized protein n=1 Tax=Desulforamulus putei DSM 12395 TaxID=1121429 RepID=A0A1M4VZB0_9FIRM|nr:hypothetical protein [Desulforamulus putei]SHE74235.1 hypothetical protein SAMN02745133_01046 [Desulforamulus putei DSM 12395]